jgi:hypothetical protein
MIRIQLMKNRLLITVFTVITLASNGITSAKAQNVTAYNIPTVLFENNYYLVDGSGIVINITDYKKLKFANPKANAAIVDCDLITGGLRDATSNTLQRTRCEKGTKFTCDTLYNNEVVTTVADRDRARMIPNRPVAYWVNKAKVARPSVDFIGVNTGFFETDRLIGRSADSDAWKPLYQEACGRTFGTSKTEGAEVWNSANSDVEVTNGKKDKPFGTILFHKWDANGGGDRVTLSKSGSIDNSVTWDDFAMNGVFVRWNGIDEDIQSSATIPDFVKEKASSKVGRTILGINPTTGRMRIMVFQPGRNIGYTGIDVNGARQLMGNKYQYPYVLLLDGSGSSQYASTSPAKRDDDYQYATPRPNCSWDSQTGGTIDECSHYGDIVDDLNVSHLSPGYRETNGPTPGTTRVDRPVPSFMIFEDN